MEMSHILSHIMRQGRKREKEKSVNFKNMPNVMLQSKSRLLNLCEIGSHSFHSLSTYQHMYVSILL